MSDTNFVDTASKMYPTDFSSKRFCLQTLLWSGLLFKSRCENAGTGGDKSELGVLGSPAVHVSTITITTTIAYRPTLAPGDSTYSLLGCYRYGSDGSGGGHPFGERGYTTPAIPPDKLTVNACFDGCASLRLLSESPDDYGFVGIRDGSQCVCGSHLIPGARKLSPEDCNIPCIGDARVSCGGTDAIAIYNLVVGDESINVESDDSSQDSQGDNRDRNKSSEAPGNKSKTAASDDTASAFLKDTGVSQLDQAEPDSLATFEITPGTTTTRTGRTSLSPQPHRTTSSRSSPISSPSPQASTDTPSTTSIIAAITASLSGAIILAAFLFIGFRAYKRKKQEQRDTPARALPEARHPRRLIPSAIDTTGHPQYSSDRRGKGRQGPGQSRDLGVGLATDGTELMPTTPALESGRRPHQSSGLHSRLKSTTSSSDRDALYNTHVLPGEMRAAPATPQPGSPSTAPLSAGASSAVQWRDPPIAAPAPLFNFDFGEAQNSSPGVGVGDRERAVMNPPPAARPAAALGDRAWHRRKLSTPFQPPPSGPPSIPLPPTPPARPRRSFDTIRFGLTPSPSPTPTPDPDQRHGASDGEEGDKGEGGKYLQPPRSTAPPPLPPPKPKSLQALGVPSHLSSRVLGTTAPVPPTPPLKDSPTLQGPLSRSHGLWGAGWGRRRTGVEEREKEKEKEKGSGQDAAPRLPPLSPGEQFDSRRWKGTAYAEDAAELDRESWTGGDRGQGEGGGKVKAEGQRQRQRQSDSQGQGEERRQEMSPISPSTIRTSILFPLEEEPGHSG
ncbi:hypothetical protein GGR54DRAFT_647733 [Hypoxylon sp. NC1633]|nr:hypothetical protein GGR54DRAFT_647733 [Hypoxylon sp. NC1633]